MGPSGLEPPTSRLSGGRSNLLSYEPSGSSAAPFRTQPVPSKLNNATPLPLRALKSDLRIFHDPSGHVLLLRKEVIQPLVLERLPCYDFTPIIEPTFGRAPLSVRLRTSGVPNSHGVTGGVYKARERIHRGMLIRDY